MEAKKEKKRSRGRPKKTQTTIQLQNQSNTLTSKKVNKADPTHIEPLMPNNFEDIKSNEMKTNKANETSSNNDSKTENRFDYSEAQKTKSTRARRLREVENMSLTDIETNLKKIKIGNSDNSDNPKKSLDKSLINSSDAVIDPKEKTEKPEELDDKPNASDNKTSGEEKENFGNGKTNDESNTTKNESEHLNEPEELYVERKEKELEESNEEREEKVTFPREGREYSDANNSSNWRSAIDHETGRQYHYNVITRQTQWSSPMDTTTQVFPTTGDYAYHSQFTGRRRRRSMKEMQDSWDRGDRVGLWECTDCTKILTEGSKKTHPDSCNARKARSVHIVQGTPSDILAGAHWKAVTNASGQTYYYHQITKQTSWYKPSEMQNFEQYQHNQSLMTNDENSGDNENQWSEVNDMNGRVYYYNSLTGATSWNKPEGFSSTTPLSRIPQLPDSKASHATDSASREEMVSSIDQAPHDIKEQTHLYGTHNDNIDEIGDWVETTDPVSGKNYFFNSVTKATSWSNPSLTKNSRLDSNVDKSNKVIKHQVDVESEIPKDLNEYNSQGRYSQAYDDVWKEAIDKSTGRKYFYNVITSETSWEIPSSYNSLESNENVVSDKTKNNENKQSVWKSVYDEKTGKTYFYNVESKETSWKLPKGAIEEDKDEDEPLWIKIFDESCGRFYYHNSASNITTWDMPEGFVESIENVQMESENPIEEGEDEKKEVKKEDNKEIEKVEEEPVGSS